jgi:hypothetical protein
MLNPLVVLLAALLATPPVTGGRDSIPAPVDSVGFRWPRESAQWLAREVRERDIHFVFVGRFWAWSPDTSDRRSSWITCLVDSVLFGEYPDSAAFSRSFPPDFAPGKLAPGTRVLAWMKQGCTRRGACGDFLIVEPDGRLSSDHPNPNQGNAPRVEAKPLRMTDVIEALRKR